MLGILAVLMLAGCAPKEKNNERNTGEVETVSEGQMAPDFTLNDPDGKPISLSDFRGQYVVLDFWGVWCKWCVKGIPDMKAYYEKYQGMFEILCIDFNDSEEKWLRAIKNYKMEWKHAITDEESAAELEELYAIEGFPTKIVVDPEGKIIHVTVGEDPAFYKFIDDLFGGK